MAPPLKILLVALACAVSSGARADAAPPPEQPELGTVPVETEEQASPPDTATRLDEIVVTATKRNQALGDVPASIAALRGAELEALGASRMQDFLKLVPGVTQTEIQPDLYRLTIRGIQSDTTTSTSQTAGIYIDDVPLADPFLSQVSPDLPPFDLQSVEVLKGPQGTLFGGSGLAGLIRYRLREAEPGRTELRGFAQYRDVADGQPEWERGAAANLPAASIPLALRLVAIGRSAGGTIDDVRNSRADTDDSRLLNGRALLAWQPADDLKVGVKALRQRLHADDVPLAETTDGHLERRRALRNSPYTTEYSVYGLDLNYQMSWARAVSETARVHKLGDLAVAYGERILGVEDAGQPISAPFYSDIGGLVQELRLESPDGEQEPWQWLVGAYGYAYSSRSFQNFHTEDTATGQDGPLLVLDAHVKAREYALFGEATRRLGERWRATLGVRGYRARTFGTVDSSGAVILAGGQTENHNDADLRASGASPKFALQFAPMPGIETYLAASRGFRFGGIQTIGPSPASPDVPTTFRSDRLWNYEVGTRTRWLEDRLWADATLFYLDWKDPQIRTTTGGAVPLNVVDNVGGARSYGMEAALRYVIPVGRGINATAAGAYTNARTTKEYTAPSGAVVPPGARLPCSSDVQASLRLAYPWSIGPVEFEASGVESYLGPGANDIPESMELYGFATTDIELASALAFVPGQPRLTFSVINLFDRRGLMAAYVDGPGNYTTVYGRTRSVGLRLELQL